MRAFASLRNYRRAYLARDAIAGLVLATMLVPAGMGYAVAAGLPAITGLYATIIPLVAYACLGPSRVLVLGPDSGLAAMIAAAIVPIAAGDPERAVALASLLALMVGVLCVIGGIVGVGFASSLISKPVRVGYMHGIALTIFVTQLPKLLGFSVHSVGVVDGIAALPGGVTDLRALAIGGGCLVIILVGRALVPKIPAIPIAIIASTAVVAGLGLAAEGLPVVGNVPRGVPLPSLVVLDPDAIRDLFGAAVGIALVAFADTAILSRTFAARQHSNVDPNHELVGLGVANAAGAFFQGFPISASASRTPVAESAGAKTQATNLFAAAAVAGSLAIPWLVHDLPITSLAAVVIAAAIGMVDVAELRRFWRVRRADFVLAISAFLAVALFGVLPGIGVAVGVSLLDFVRRAWRPYDAVLGRTPQVDGYHDLERYPGAEQMPGLLLLRWDAPLFFANADTFYARALERIDAAPSKLVWLVVAAEPITDVDTTAAEMLESLDRELTTRGIDLAFAEMKDPVKDRLRRYGLLQRIGEDRFFPTLEVAVKAFMVTTHHARRTAPDD